MLNIIICQLNKTIKKLPLIWEASDFVMDFVGLKGFGIVNVDVISVCSDVVAVNLGVVAVDLDVVASGDSIAITGFNLNSFSENKLIFGIVMGVICFFFLVVELRQYLDLLIMQF